MIVNGSKVSWGPVLWCDECDQVMKFLKPEGYWSCPECGTLVLGEDLDPPEDDYA